MTTIHTSMAMTAIFMVILNGTTLAGKVCDTDQYLTKKGKCRNCRFCPPGEGMDFSAKVRINQDGVPVACHPCKKCAEGYYNDPDTGQYECSKCRLNCIAMNRKEYEPCGGTKPGRCDGCINSLYEDRENNIDSPCTRKEEMIRLNRKIQPETNDEVLSNGDSELKDHLRSGPTVNSSPTEWIYGVIIGLVLVLVVLTLVATVYIVKKKGKCPHRSNNLATELSRTSLLESTTTEGSDKNQYQGTNLEENNDIEIDGPAHECNPHGEIQSNRSSGPTELHMTSEACSKYPHTVVHQGDVYFQYLAKHLYGHQVSEVFRTLEVRDQKIFAELELYRMDIIKYEDAIYRLLLHWVRLKTNSATLNVLCPILDNSGLRKLSHQLLSLAENSAATIYEKTQAGNEPYRKETFSENMNNNSDNVLPEESCCLSIQSSANLDQPTFSETKSSIPAEGEAFSLDSLQDLSVTSFDIVDEVEEEHSL